MSPLPSARATATKHSQLNNQYCRFYGLLRKAMFALRFIRMTKVLNRRIYIWNPFGTLDELFASTLGYC